MQFANLIIPFDALRWVFNSRFQYISGDFMEAYCVKCKGKKEMSNPKAVTMKNGKKATSGSCPDCGTKMFKIGG